MNQPIFLTSSLAAVARCALALSACALWSSHAAAAAFRIDFYVGAMTGSVDTSDWDGDGIVDYSGLFTSDTAGSVTSFDVTIGSERYDLLDTSAFPGAPKYTEPSAFWPIGWIRGFVFDEAFAGPGDTVTVLQMDSFGIGDGQGGFKFYGGWALSPCTQGDWCGGGPYQGSYTITELNAVPAPASLPLVALGLLAALRRRTG